MTDIEMEILSEELADLETVIIFLNDGLRRTMDLLNNATKHGYPDLDARIERIQSAIDRFWPRTQNIRAWLRVEEKTRADIAKKAVTK